MKKQIKDLRKELRKDDEEVKNEGERETKAQKGSLVEEIRENMLKFK